MAHVTRTESGDMYVAGLELCLSHPRRDMGYCDDKVKVGCPTEWTSVLSNTGSLRIVAS